MYYLKCDSCDLLNEVKSEYLTFCSSCGRKFDNSFMLWKSDNPSKSFDEYLKEVCFDPENVPLQNRDTKPFSVKLLILRLAAAVAGILILMMIIVFWKDYTKKIFDKPLDKLASKEWSIQGCGSSGLNIESPVKLGKSNNLIKKIDPETRKYVVLAESFEGSYGSNLFIIMNAVTFVPDVETSLRGAANGAISEIQSQKGIKNFVYSESQLERSGLTGILQMGNYLRKGKKYGFYNTVFTRGQQSWQVQVVFNTTEKAGEQIARRIINSIFIATPI